VDEKNTFATLRAKDEPGFHNVRKHKDSERFRFSFSGCRILRHELLQSVTGITHQVGGRRFSGK
jgi:hypothetical protein